MWVKIETAPLQGCRTHSRADDGSDQSSLILTFKQTWTDAPKIEKPAILPETLAFLYAHTNNAGRCAYTHSHTYTNTEGLGIICMWQWLTNRGWCCIAGPDTEGHIFITTVSDHEHITACLSNMGFITDDWLKRKMTPLMDDNDIRSHYLLLIRLRWFGGSLTPH